jgi:hypothetical protein
MSHLPDYLSSISFTNPDGPSNTLFHYVTQTKLGFFEWLHTQPKQFAVFSAAMAASFARQEDALTAKVAELFPTDGSEHDVVIIDVGGGRGQILNGLRKARRDLKGQMIVQDLPREIDGRDSLEEVQGMAYDFFTPQPVQGKSFPPSVHDVCASQFIPRRRLHIFLPTHIPRLARPFLSEDSSANYAGYEAWLLAYLDIGSDTAEHRGFGVLGTARY